MLSSEARSRLCVVLVGARNPQNIGAAARAMQDFGFNDLRVVNSYAPPFEAAQLQATSAVAADTIMRSAMLFSVLSDAIADCTYTVGTTAIGGRGLQRPVVALPEACPSILSHLNGKTASTSATEGLEADDRSRVALLFGSEKTGLTKEQLSFCSDLLTIPMYAPAERHLSMNLGQSVAVCLYELTRHGFEGARELPVIEQPLPEVRDRERVLQLLMEAMKVSGYAQRFPANARPEVVRRLTAHLGSTREEASTWMGFFRQILKRMPEAE